MVSEPKFTIDDIKLVSFTELRRKMSEDKSAGLLSSNPQPDNAPTGDDQVGDGGVKQFLMQAWQNLAMYVAATEEPEGAAAGMMLLQGLRHLISGENLADIMGGQPQPPQPGQQPPQPGQPDPNAPQQPQQNPQAQNPQQPQPGQQSVNDPNAAPQQPQDPNQPRQVSPFGTTQQAPQSPSGSGGGTAPKKKAASSSGSTPKKKAAAKKKARPKTATAAMEWLLDAAADYSCASCDRNFGTEAGLRAHLKSVHTTMKGY